MQVAGIERGADLVQRNPSPGEIYVGDGALFADAGDGHEFASSDGDQEQRFGGLIGRKQRSNGIDAGCGQHHIPAGRGHEARRAARGGGGDPAVLLQHEVFG